MYINSQKNEKIIEIPDIQQYQSLKQNVFMLNYSLLFLISYKQFYGQDMSTFLSSGYNQCIRGNNCLFLLSLDAVAMTKRLRAQNIWWQSTKAERETQKRTNTETKIQRCRRWRTATRKHTAPQENEQSHGKMKPNSLAGMRDRD
jgi:hypothetical protein